MADTPTEVRAEIEQTRARMSSAIDELERKIDVTQRISQHPWIAVGVAFGAGIALSATKADVQAAKATVAATQKTGTKLGTALDGVVAALVAGVTEALHSRVDSAVSQVVTSVRGTSTPTPSSSRSFGTADRPTEVPIRAD
jgi:hypothetical protein